MEIINSLINTLIFILKYINLSDIEKKLLEDKINKEVLIKYLEKK